MQQGHKFSKKHGFTGSAGMTPVRGHLRRPVKVTKDNVVDVVRKHVNETVPPAHMGKK